MKTVSVITKQTKKGDDYHVFTLENGKPLSVFQFDSRYAAIGVGTEIPDSELIYDDAYGNYKLKEQPRGPQIKTPGGYKSVQINQAMEKKEASIEKFQGRKEESIKLAGAMRDATLVSLASLRDQPFPSDEEYKAEYEKWLKYFFNIGEQPFI